MLHTILSWAVPFVCGGIATGIIAYIKHKRRQHSANDRGTQCLLRAEIIRDYKEYSHKGYCPIYAKTALEITYKAYSDLGGNDVATEMYEYMMQLPTEPPEVKEQEE